MICTPGNYRARAIAPVVFQKSSKQETPGATVSVRLEEGPNKGSILEWTGWLSEKSKPRTVEALIAMGFDGDDPASVQKNEVIAVVDNETSEYTNDAGEKKTRTEARVQWINDPNRAGGAKFIALTDAERASIAGDLRAAVAAQKAAAPSDPLEFPPKDGPKLKF